MCRNYTTQIIPEPPEPTRPSLISFIQSAYRFIPPLATIGALQVGVKPGAQVVAGQQLVVMSAMKMETAVCSPCSGTVTQVAVAKGDNLDAGDLIVAIDVSAAAA